MGVRRREPILAAALPTALHCDSVNRLSDSGILATAHLPCVRESGGIGRRAGLRIQSRKGWGFESPLSHQVMKLGNGVHSFVFHVSC